MQNPFKQKPRSTLSRFADEEHKHTRTLTQSEINTRMKRINEDFHHAFTLLQHHADTVTFFGSSRFDPSNQYYREARALARRIVEEIGSTIVTGGGSGIMAAANQGAEEVQGESVGMTIELPNEQVTNDYVNDTVDFYYFFSRKVALTFTARAYIFYPGGFGTLDEFFEIVTLKQTGKINPIPIVLIGSQYWRPLLDFIDQQLAEAFATIEPGDSSLFTLTDDIDEVMRIISNQDVAAFNHAT
ncbi:TIGR00730 family Rossman fold protein [Candidatus Saccharibacteria bacterium QS_5_54_17]|nr:MAG: TIGR00730 family Rossman fold protein [Candidatus Saccharibacteria bacterium QS_5_54_17]